MNEKILKRLGLPADATPEAIEDRISLVIDDNDKLNKLVLDQAEQLEKLEAAYEKIQIAAKPVETDAAKLEKRILAKIAESGGALNRDQALIAIQHQDEHKPKAKAKK